MKCIWEISACCFLSTIYVASLYVWKSPLPRCHPSIIKRRFVSAIVINLVSLLFVDLYFGEKELRSYSLWQHIGVRTAGLLPALILPLLLTVVLFIGPISILYVSGLWKVYSEPMYWMNNISDIVWLRNHVIAPLSEEFTFRACMMPILLQCLPPMSAVFICPLFFGIAHFHHFLGYINEGWDVSTAIKASCFQLIYTTLFGAYSAFLFARTGHFAAPVVAHMFCNHMGFPNFGEILHFDKPQRIIISILFVAGLISWCFLLFPLTEPSYYNNELHWNNA